jgi:hypothetical protein
MSSFSAKIRHPPRIAPEIRSAAPVRKALAARSDLWPARTVGGAERLTVYAGSDVMTTASLSGRAGGTVKGPSGDAHCAWFSRSRLARQYSGARVYKPSHEQVVSRANPTRLLPYNYVVFGVRRYEGT